MCTQTYIRICVLLFQHKETLPGQATVRRHAAYHTITVNRTATFVGTDTTSILMEMMIDCVMIAQL